MRTLLNHPVILLLVTFAFLWLAARFGAVLQIRRGSLDENERADFDIVLGATLTLLSLLVGFSFSMASSRYDQRKTYEAEEANAIGTAYARAELLPSADATKVRQLLKEYTDLRIRFFTTVDSAQVRALTSATRRKQEQLWGAVAAAARAAPSATSALAAAAMNSTIDAEGYSQAAAWNRIPLAAWVLLFMLGAVSTTMVGYRFRMGAGHHKLVLILPAIVSVAFFLVADIDCPGAGVIRVAPDNLMALMPSLS